MSKTTQENPAVEHSVAETVSNTSKARTRTRKTTDTASTSATPTTTTTRTRANSSPLAALSSLRQQHVLRYWLQQQQLPLPDRQGLQAIWTEVCLARMDAQAVYRYGHVEVRRYRQRLYVQYRQTQEPQARIWQDG